MRWMIALLILTLSGCGTTKITMAPGKRLIHHERKIVGPGFVYEDTFDYEGETEDDTIIEPVFEQET